MADLAGAVILSGLVIVFAALIILIGVVQLTGRVLNKEAYTPKKTAQDAPTAPFPSPAPAAALSPAPAIQGGIPGETVAVISAAVAAMMDEQAPGSSYSVTSIQRSHGARPVWGFAGMQQNTRPF